jgi:isopenicillin-N epimerase
VRAGRHRLHHRFPRDRCDARHNHALVWQAAQALTARWGLPWQTPEALVGCMATLPLPARLGTTPADAQRLRQWLLDARGIEVAIVARGDRLWARVSGQVYNDMADIERLGDAVDGA